MKSMEPDFTSKKILIVDDDRYVAKIMRSILEAFEVGQVHLAVTYDDAVKILNNRRFDCIFVDNMTCEKNGLELARYIRHSEDEELRVIPIILSTTFTGFKSIISARDAGVTEILAKPVSPDQIIEKMANAIFKQRDFIDNDVYSGPDRRRRIRDYDGSNDRRKIEIPLPVESKTILDEGAKDT